MVDWKGEVAVWLDEAVAAENAVNKILLTLPEMLKKFSSAGRSW